MLFIILNYIIKIIIKTKYLNISCLLISIKIQNCILIAIIEQNHNKSLNWVNWGKRVNGARKLIQQHQMGDIKSSF